MGSTTIRSAADTADAAIVADDSPFQLEKYTVVQARDDDALAPPDAASAKRKLDQVAGGTALIKAEDVGRGSIVTNADTLAFQPGVFVDTVDGGDAIKISIRGSAQNKGGGQGSFRSGVLFLFDGLPLTGPGGTPYELLEPLGLSYTEVLKGPNAFNLGSVTLGGALNFVTKTGYDASPIAGRVEFGSFGYRKFQVSSGLVRGAADYYIT